MPWRTTRLCPWYPWWLATGQKARCWWCATTRTSPGWKSSSPYLLTAAAISWPPLSRISTQRDCFLIRWDLEEAVWLYPEDLRVRGYAADGTLIYQSPLPESWAEDYSIPDPDNWRFRYEALYPGEVGS